MHKTSTKFKTLTGENLKVHGKVYVKVKGVDGKSQKVPLYVIGEKGKHYSSLLGRDWLGQVKLDWQRIFGVKNVQTNSGIPNSLEEEIAKYAVFKEERGCIEWKRMQFLKDVIVKSTDVQITHILLYKNLKQNKYCITVTNNNGIENQGA